MMILMLHILYQKHHLDLPKCLVENLMFFTSNISYILNAAANIFKGCGIFDLIFLSNMLLLLLTAANMFMSQIQAIIQHFAYSAKSAHPFRRNGAPFRLKLSNAQLVN